MSEDGQRRVGLLETLRGLTVPVYLPWMTGGLGVAMLIPIFPLYLRDAGLSFTMVSVVIAATGIGATLGGMPMGALLARLGEHQVMIIALGVMAGATAVLGLTDAVVALTALRLAHGAGTVGLRLSRQTYVTRTVEPDVRGRSLALMGGSMRVSTLIGPVVGGLLADSIGYRWTFAISGAITLLGLVPVLALGNGDDDDPDDPSGASADVERDGLWTTIVRHRRKLIIGGFGPALVMSVRQGRTIVLPLIGAALDLSPSAIGFLVAVGNSADLLLFPVAGYVMDRYGRLASIVPSFGLLGIGMFILSAADGPAGVVVAGIVMGVGNGLGSGTMLTLGSDLAPRDNPGPFLSALGSIQNLGRIIGPMIVGWFADAVGLRASAAALGVTMFIAIAWIVLLIGETSDGRAKV